MGRLRHLFKKFQVRGDKGHGLTDISPDFQNRLFPRAINRAKPF